MSNKITVSSTDNNIIKVQAPGPQGPQGTGGSTWGAITGTLSDQTDLQAALDAKADVRNIVEVSAIYTTSASDAAVIATGTFTITLHALSTATEQIVIKNVSGTITVDGDGSETIDGSLTQVITTDQSLTLIPTSTGWVIV